MTMGAIAEEVLLSAGEAVEEEMQLDPHVSEPQVCIPQDCSDHETKIQALTASLEQLQHDYMKTMEESSPSCERQCQKRQEETEVSCQETIQELQKSCEQKLMETTHEISRLSKEEEENQSQKLEEVQVELERLQKDRQLEREQSDEITRQLERTAAQLQTLLEENERQNRENEQLKGASRTVEDRWAKSVQGEQERVVNLKSQLHTLRSQLDHSKQQLFEARQEVHQIWEQYVLMRDAWWNVPTRYQAIEKFCRQQWLEVQARVDALYEAVLPYARRLQRGWIVATTTAKETGTNLIEFMQDWTHNWFLPKWRQYCQPHVRRLALWFSQQVQRLWNIMAIQWGAFTQFASHQWSLVMDATAPQRQQVQQALQPTLDMLSAQLGPVTAAIIESHRSLESRINSSGYLNATEHFLYESEILYLTCIITLSDTARDYLILQQAPGWMIQLAEGVHRLASADARSVLPTFSPSLSRLSTSTFPRTRIVLIIYVAIFVLWISARRCKKKTATIEKDPKANTFIPPNHKLNASGGGNAKHNESPKKRQQS